MIIETAISNNINYGHTGTSTPTINPCNYCNDTVCAFSEGYWLSEEIDLDSKRLCGSKRRSQNDSKI